MNFLQGLTSQSRSVALVSQARSTPQFRTLVLRFHAVDPEERIGLQQTHCYADFVEPEVSRDIGDGYEVTADDYMVCGCSLLAIPRSQYINNGSEFFLGSQIVSNEISGGFACELLTYLEDIAGITLFLRRKPDQRRDT